MMPIAPVCYFFAQGSSAREAHQSISTSTAPVVKYADGHGFTFIGACAPMATRSSSSMQSKSAMGTCVNW